MQMLRACPREAASELLEKLTGKDQELR